MRVFIDAFGNRGRVWHIDDPVRHANYPVVGLCGVRLVSHYAVDTVPDSKRQKICAKCLRTRAVEAADFPTLQRAADLRRRFDAGIFAKEPSERARFKRLEARGLISFDDYGRDIDANDMGGPDVAIYKLTAKGAALVERDEIERAKENIRLQDGPQ